MRSDSIVQHDMAETDLTAVITGRIAFLHDRLYYGDLTSEERAEVEVQIEEWRERLAPPPRQDEADPVEDDSDFWPIDIGGEG